MRYVYSGFAALLCLAALLANLGDMPTFVALACLAVAAIFLVLALRTNQTLQLQWHCADPIDLAHEHRPSSRFLAPRGNTRQKTPLRPAVLRQEELSAVQVDPAAAMALAPVLVAAHHRQIRPG